MKTVVHKLEFVTEFDENHPTAKQLLSLPHDFQVTILEGMLKDLLAPRLQSILDELNENNSYAKLKVVH
jgi:hypothetical protein